MWNVWPDWYWLETAQTFDGIDDKVTIENTDQLNFSGEITLSAWVKIEETGGYRGILEHGYYGGREVFLRVASGKYQVGIYQSKTNSMAEAAVDPADIGTWVHLVGTYDGSSWNLYKNGELIASSLSTVGVLPVNCDWLIGGSQATNRCFKGEIRDAGIWNVAMTPDEVSTHYTQGFSQAVASSATYDALGRLLTTTDDVLWSLTDHLGTVRDILGDTSTHLIYDSFGNLISGTNPLLFGYTGKAFDTDTQLQNNINRWYDATIGRWLSTDPIGFEGNDTNLYRYVRNNSMLLLDAMGLDYWLETTKRVGSMHWRICVSVRNNSCEIIGKYCISFGINSNIKDKNKNGVIFEDLKDDTLFKQPLSISSSNCECDRSILKYFQALVGNVDGYRVLGYNCQHFSSMIYVKIGKMIENGELEGCCK